MERSEKVGFGVALVGHALLFGALSLGFLDTPNPAKLKQSPIDVSLVTDVGLEAAAPAATEPPSQRVSPEEGEPVDAAPPADEAPPEPVPAPAPAPKPEPRPAPPKPEAAKPEPAKAAPKPAPAPKPVPKAPSKPAPKPPAAEKSPAKTERAKPDASSSASKSKTPPAASRGKGASEKATAERQRGGRLGDNFLKGLVPEKTAARNSDSPPSAARVDGKALASIVQAIARQIQPCADRQVDPGPGANEIVTTLNLRLNRDGTLAATPTMVKQAGVTDENQRYARRVVDLGVAAFKGCSPLKLPAEYYSTANGGWSNINYNWKLR